MQMFGKLEEKRNLYFTIYSLPPFKKRSRATEILQSLNRKRGAVCFFFDINKRFHH